MSLVSDTCIKRTRKASVNLLHRDASEQAPGPALAVSQVRVSYKSLIDACHRCAVLLRCSTLSSHPGLRCSLTWECPACIALLQNYLHMQKMVWRIIGQSYERPCNDLLQTCMQRFCWGVGVCQFGGCAFPNAM